MVERIMTVVASLLLAGLAGPLVGVEADALSPLTPTNLHVDYDETAGAYVLTWDAYASGETTTYQLYRGGTLIFDGDALMVYDADYGSFNLYYVTATNANGTSLPSSPVGVVTCGSSAPCSPDAFAQAAAWSSYRFIDYYNGFVTICQVVDVNLFPFGYMIYFDCIRRMLNDISPTLAAQLNSCVALVQFQLYGNRCIP